MYVCMYVYPHHTSSHLPYSHHISITSPLFSLILITSQLPSLHFITQPLSPSHLPYPHHIFIPSPLTSSHLHPIPSHLPYPNHISTILIAFPLSPSLSPLRLICVWRTKTAFAVKLVTWTGGTALLVRQTVLRR